jgi:Xaa-Pro aminopeptidase
MDKCTLFVAPNKLDDAAKTYLQSIDVNVMDYEQVFAYLQGLSVDSIMYDGSKVDEALYEAINSQVKKVNVSPSPVLKMQSVKNATELEGERIAMRKDAVALTKFLYWLETEALQTPQTEITLAKKLGE